MLHSVNTEYHGETKKTMISLKLRLIREQNRVYTFMLKMFSALRPNGPKVFLFHDMLGRVEDVQTKFAISQASFETFLFKQINSGKKAITFNELSDMIAGKAPMQPDTFIVTFDDANESVFTNAYPFLKAHQIPFIIFITKELIGKKNFLNKEQVIALANEPLCTVGSHGIHHVMFRYLSVQEAKIEFTESKMFLEELTGKPVTCFALPYGRLVECSCKNISTLSKSVYDFAFSAIAGNLSLKALTGKYYLPRVNVDEKMANGL